MNEEQFRQLVRKTILEQKSDPETAPQPKAKESSDEPNKKKKKKKQPSSETKPGEIGVSVGRGAWSKQVQEAGALASDNAGELMKRLGIDKSGSDLKGVMTIIQQAMENEIMGQAYGQISSINKGSKQGLQVIPTGIDVRNGIKYIQHTLMGAKNSGKLSLGVPLQVAPLDDGTIIIYVSNKKGNW